MSTASNLLNIRAGIPENIDLVAVSKTKSREDIMEAYDAGQRIFGENKIQEMAEKWSVLPKDIKWHMIGHVQRNKVKYMAGFVDLVHGVDSLKLLKELDKQAKAAGRNIRCLLQISIADEETKFGLTEDEMWEIVHSDPALKFPNIQIVGLMGIATFTENEVQLRKEFSSLQSLYRKLQEAMNGISILSMGMSADFRLAIENGSNMVRIGSSIFGNRS